MFSLRRYITARYTYGEDLSGTFALSVWQRSGGFNGGFGGGIRPMVADALPGRGSGGGGGGGAQVGPGGIHLFFCPNYLCLIP